MVNLFCSHIMITCLNSVKNVLMRSGKYILQRNYRTDIAGNGFAILMVTIVPARFMPALGSSISPVAFPIILKIP